MDAIAAATITFLLFISLLITGTRAETQPKQIALGFSLSPSSTPWLSSSGLFAFGFYQQGSGFVVGIWLVGKKSQTVVWTAFRDDPPVTSNAKLQLTKDGKLILITEQGPEKDDGNLVLYPANTTDTRRDAYWSSDTQVDAGSKNHLYLNKTGLLQIMNTSNLEVDSLITDSSSINNGNQTTIYRATLDFDGVFQLNAHVNGSDNKIEKWPKEGTCEVKGFCGFNSYCTFNDDQPVCNCLKGFDFIDANQETLGCKRNSSKVECRSEKDSAAFYNMASMNNIIWEDHPYFKAEMSQEEECSSSCLADCNCWAALYQYNGVSGGTCKKQGLPLRYVKRRIPRHS
ncbi:S-locus glycoprotein domain [Sesbania bispinosa]|nr:S-locus glycoprotein domain [Sesbania bispinosa]